LKDGFDHALRSLLRLHEIGLKDIGFGITVSDDNAKDLLELYSLSEWLGVEFATAVVHNSYYFHKYDNSIKEPAAVKDELKKLIEKLLGSRQPKNWFRAYFNYGLVNYVKGNPRLLPCYMGTDVFFMDPLGEIMPCNGMETSMGNIKYKLFEKIWNSPEASEVRAAVSKCEKNCWMIGSAAPAMKKNIIKPVAWIVKNKWSLMRGMELKEP